MARLPIPAAASDGARSLWWQDALARHPPSAPTSLDAAIDADVCIIGGGYTGLWSAIEIKRREPGASVAVLEAKRCGSQASGRNGGMALSWWAKLDTLVKRVGPAAALRLAHASEQAIVELGRFSAEHGVEFDFRQGGWLWTATSPAQQRAWSGALQTCERLGVHPFQELDRQEIARRLGSDAHLGGVFEPGCATVQPALLALALRAAALELGVSVLENSPVSGLDLDAGEATGSGGRVCAKTFVLATNVWAASLPRLGRAILPLSSDVVATEPIPELLHENGWTGGESVSDSRLMVHYLHTTAGGRIVFGRGGGSLAFAGRVNGRFDHHAARSKEIAEDLRRIVPFARDARITHEWSGAVDRSTDGLPFFGRLRGRTPAFYGAGLSGNGVAPTVLAGRILASCALGAEDEWSRCGLARGVPGRFPPEPLRVVGGALVKRAVANKESTEDRGGRARAADRWLSRLAPPGFARVSDERKR